MATNPTTSPKKASSKPKHSTYAIVEASGKQFRLEPSRYYDFDRIKADVNETISIEKVLLISDEKGTEVGKPYVKGASVELKILEHRRGPKLIVYKMRPKKKTRRKNGHRQELTRVMVESISIAKSKPKKATKTKESSQIEPATSKVKKTTKKAES